MNTVDIDTVTTGSLRAYRELKLSDRCDSCGEASQAFVRIVKLIDRKEHELFFCGHHFARYEPKLLAEGWLIQDERNKINQKPQSGSKYDDAED